MAPLPRSLLILPLLGCSTTTCPTEDCSGEGLTVQFEHAAWEDGPWTLNLVLDGEPFTCNVTFPIGDMDAALCGDGKITLTFVDGALDHLYADGLGLESAVITLTQGGMTRAEIDTSPIEEKFFPNGPGCPPSCVRTELTITF